MITTDENNDIDVELLLTELLIYYVLTTSNENETLTVENCIKVLQKELEESKKNATLFDQFPQEHPITELYSIFKGMEKATYQTIINSLLPKLTEYHLFGNTNKLMSLSSSQEVHEFARVILSFYGLVDLKARLTKLRNCFYYKMNINEQQKIDDLKLNDVILKLQSSSYQVKYIENHGYVIIKYLGYLHLVDGSEIENYSAQKSNSEEVVKNEIAKIYNDIANNFDKANETKKYNDGWDFITQEADRNYPGQTDPKHYGTLVNWRVGGPDPLDGISVYDGGEYWHFVTYGLSELYEKESENKELSGYGMEFTLKLKKDKYENEEDEIRCVCGLLQQIARMTFTNGEIFKPYEYLYTGQTEGIDALKKSNITGFITIPDTKFKPINTPNGKVEFVEFIGATNEELLALVNKKIRIRELYQKIGSDITDYNRKSALENPSKISEVKNTLRKKAIGFETGGIRPTNQLGESWIGKVCWQAPGESWPLGENGEKMIPLATLFLDGLEYIPNSLKDIKMINIFVDVCLLDNLAEDSYKKWFKIYTYESLDNLVKCDYTSEQLIPFPLVPQMVDNEFPNWEDIDDELLNVILDMEANNDIDYYRDIYEGNYYSHKIGGYPSSIQGRVEYDEDYEFVLQISSDEKAEFNIVDSGNFYFGYNSTTKEWEVRCDFH